MLAAIASDIAAHLTVFGINLRAAAERSEFFACQSY
jgi:hypothetical protein